MRTFSGSTKVSGGSTSLNATKSLHAATSSRKLRLRRYIAEVDYRPHKAAACRMAHHLAENSMKAGAPKTLSRGQICWLFYFSVMCRIRTLPSQHSLAASPTVFFSNLSASFLRYHTKYEFICAHLPAVLIASALGSFFFSGFRIPPRQRLLRKIAQSLFKVAASNPTASNNGGKRNPSCSNPTEVVATTSKACISICSPTICREIGF